MKHSQGTPNNLKNPSCEEDKIFLVYYKKMEDRLKKIEEKIDECEKDCVSKEDCKEQRSQDRINFDNLFGMTKQLYEGAIKMKSSLDSMLESLKGIAEKLETQDDLTKENTVSITKLEVWRAGMVGGLVVITILTIPLLVYIWNQSQDSKEHDSLAIVLNKLNSKLQVE